MSVHSWRRFHITEMLKKGSIWTVVLPLPHLLPFSPPLRKHFSDWVPGSSRVGQILNGEGGLCVFSFVFLCVFVEIHIEIHSACEFSFRMTTRHAQRRTHLFKVNWNSGQVLLVLRSNPTPLSQFPVGPQGRGWGSDRGGRRVGRPDDDGDGRWMEKDRFSYRGKDVPIVARRLPTVLPPSCLQSLSPDQVWCLSLSSDIDAHFLEWLKKTIHGKWHKSYCLIMIAWWLMT